LYVNELLVEIPAFLCRLEEPVDELDGDLVARHQRRHVLGQNDETRRL
jgi:hypothetical protein